MLCYLPKRDLADRSAAYRLLLDYNPFYALSAMFMLAGLFSLNDSLDWSPLPVGNIIILIATLNLYEMLLIGMAWFLLRQRGARRDAHVLLIIEAVFLVDAGFLNAELFAQDLAIGLVVNALLLSLATVKLTVVFYMQRLPLSRPPFALAVLQVAALTGMPGVLKYVALTQDGTVPALALYAFWWLAGGLVALWGLMLRCVDFSDAPRIDPFGRNRAVVGAFLLLGLISFLAHLCTSNWVYDVRWYTANLAPVLLGLAVAAGALGSDVLRRRRREQATLALPLGAIMISAAFPSALEFAMPQHLPLTPLRLALLAAAAVYALGLWRFRQPVFVMMAAGCVVLAALGASVAAIVQTIMTFNRTVALALRGWTPKRDVHWGVLSVVVSFALLALGLLFSIRKSERLH